MRIFLLIFMLCVAFIAPIFGAEIKEIKYENLIRISNLIANEIANIKVGDKLDKKKVNDAIVAFYKQDYFDDIVAEFEGGVLTFKFTQKPSINNIEIKGYGNEEETSGIEKLINIKKGDTYDIYKEKFAKNTIINALEEKGIYNSVVEVTATKVDDAISLVFSVNKGENIIIKNSIYQGATLDKDELESLSANKERHSWLGWLPWFSNGELKTKELEFDNLRIQDIYMRQGFLDAVVSTPLVETNFTDYSATMIYKIQEGQKYKVREIAIVKNDDVEEVFSEEELRDLIKLESDEYFNIETIRQDIENLKSHIMDKGYAFARVNPDLHKEGGESDGEAVVDVTYSIDIGKKVHINDIIITGNTNSSDRIVRRELTIAPGDLYSITKIRKSKNALLRSGLFDNANISEMRVSEDSMNLLVEVLEGRTGEIMFGLGYGSYDKLMINGSLRERNLFGTGMNVQLYVNWSKYTQMYNIGLTNPRVLDSEYSLSFNVYKSYFDNYDYIEDSIGFNAAVGRNITDELSVNANYTLVHTKLTDFDNLESAAAYRTYFPAKGLLKSSITPGIFFDNTDDYYFPKNGAIVQATAEFAGLGGNTAFTKLYAKTGLYYHLKELTTLDLILRYKAQIGAFFNHNSKIHPINETFYMGGIGTVRGYETYSLTPRDNQNLRIGGNYMFVNSAEISYGLLEAINMRVALFFDYGMIGKNSFNEIQRMSWGAALEWVSPIGPLVFVFPFAIKPQPDDRTSKFEFTMGTRF